jgi:hypothetical protein
MQQESVDSVAEIVVRTSAIRGCGRSLVHPEEPVFFTARLIGMRESWILDQKWVLPRRHIGKR